MKYIFKILCIVAVSITFSCEIHEDRKVINETYGIYPDFISGNNSVYNLLDVDNSVVDFSVNAYTSGDASISSGEIHVTVNGVTNKLLDISSYPLNVSASLSEVLTATGLNSSGVTGGDIVTFTAVFISGKNETLTSTNSISASIVCPPYDGTYIIAMQDSYGDGWQGGQIVATLDGEETRFTICDYWSGSCTISDFTSQTETFEVPSTANALTWEWEDDTYNSEVSFQITDPNGTVISNITNPSGGIISVPSTCP